MYTISLGCPHGYFGQNCSQSCGCHGNSSCGAVMGRCHCSAGRTGKYCDQGQVKKYTYM